MPLPELMLDGTSDCTEDDDDAASDATGHLPDEDRFRRLFGEFDANQDGFLDKSDLERMCRQLGVDEQAVPLILSQLGADHLGQVSCDDFLRAWLGLRAEVERLQQPPAAAAELMADTQHLLTADIETQGDCVSWSSGVTSGDPADPALQPDSLLVLLERAGHNPAEHPDLLAAADQVHQAAVSALRTELAVASARLAQLTEENGQLQRTLSKTLREAARGEREAAGRQERAAERYEQRLVELHSVIAELTRKLQRQRAGAIAEEDEDDLLEAAGSEDALSSVAAAADRDGAPAADGLSADLPSAADAASVGEPADASGGPGGHSADKACQMTDLSADEADEPPPPPAPELAPPLSPTGAERSAASPAPRERATSPPPPPPPPLTAGRQGLQQEIYSLVKENDRLQDRVGRQEAEINRCRISTESAAEERDLLRRKLVEYQRLVDCSSPRSGRSRGSTGPPQTAELSPVPRMAERVRLRPSSSGVTGSDLSACGIQSSKMAEHLVQGYQGASAAQEALHDAGGSSSGSGSSLSDRLLLAELETDRLRARLDHAQSQTDVLGLTLEAACAQSEHLAALCGKYESNCVALQLAAEAGDQLTEAFDLLVALQDSELALLLASCRAAGLGLPAGRPPPADAETALRVASEQRRSCENVARHALSRLEGRAAGASEDGSQNTSTTSSSSSGVDVDVSRSDESRVRQHIQRLKVERALVSRTAVQLESTCYAPPPPRPLTPAAAQRLDLEHAVLMQELMALREDRADLRARLFLLERERTGLELQLASRAASEQAHRLQVQQLRSQLADTGSPQHQQQQQQHEDDAEAGGGGGGDEGGDAAGSGGGGGASPSRRQTALRSQLRQLSASLDEVTRTADQRQQHADQFIAELKRANGALADALDKTKRKYQAKLKRLEQQMLQIVERHSSQQHQRGPQASLPPAEQASPCPPVAAAASAAARPPLASPRTSPGAASSRLPVMSPAGRPPAAAAAAMAPSAASPLRMAATAGRRGSPAGRRAAPSTPKRTAPPPPPLSLRHPTGGPT